MVFLPFWCERVLVFNTESRLCVICMLGGHKTARGITGLCNADIDCTWKDAPFNYDLGIYSIQSERLFWSRPSSKGLEMHLDKQHSYLQAGLKRLIRPITILIGTIQQLESVLGRNLRFKPWSCLLLLSWPLKSVYSPRHCRPFFHRQIIACIWKNRWDVIKLSFLLQSDAEPLKV